MPLISQLANFVFSLVLWGLGEHKESHFPEVVLLQVVDLIHRSQICLGTVEWSYCLSITSLSPTANHFLSWGSGSQGWISWMLLAQGLSGGRSWRDELELQSLKPHLGERTGSKFTYMAVGRWLQFLVIWGLFHRAICYGRVTGLNDTIHCNFHLALFIRNESLNPVHTRREGITQGIARAWKPRYRWGSSWILYYHHPLTDRLQF
jgi:hypothetical protein